MNTLRLAQQGFFALIVAIVVSLGLTTVMAPNAHAATYRTDSATEKHATIADSDARIWGGIDGSRFGDSIRQTARVTYKDAGVAPHASCDVTGDLQTDLIFLSPKENALFVLPYLPYGDNQDSVERSIEQQPNLLRFDLPEAQGSWQVSCVKVAQGTKPSLALSNGNTLYITSSGKLESSGSLPIYAQYTFPAKINALSSVTPGLDAPGLVVSSGTQLHYFETLPATYDSFPSSKVWELGNHDQVVLEPLGYAVDEAETIGIGVPDSSMVYALPLNSEAGLVSHAATSIVGTDNSRFGASLVAVNDINDDGLDDFAVGAPQANNGTGAVAIIQGGTKRSIKAVLDSTSAGAIKDDERSAGFLIRQAEPGQIGTSLSYIPGVDINHPGALVVGRPHHSEHPGALVISASQLNQDWNSGLGIDSIPASSMSWMASGDSEEDIGTMTGVIPTSNSDDYLTGVLTANSAGLVNLWTVDMSRQGETTDPVSPLYPQPEITEPPTNYTPINTDREKSWLGEFGSGFGGSIAHGRCDVTGDGIADIVAGGPTRSEWNFDPHYEDSTPTHGWVSNVTGHIEVIPGTTPGGTLPVEGSITILGPQVTHSPAVDAAIGLAVSCAGDINGDGTGDIVFSSPSMGRVWVIYGGADLAETDLNSLDPQRGFYVDLPHEVGAAGFSVTHVGDVNGDGLDDIGFVVSNTGLANKETGQTYGSAFIVEGNKTGTTVDLRDLNAENPHVLRRIDTPAEHTLSAFAPVGDVNGDGREDYVLADFNWFHTTGTVPGAAWVVYGNDDAYVDLSRSYAGYTLAVPTDASYRLGAGHSIASAGDIDNDGFDDFVIGFDGGLPPSQTTGGVALVMGTSSAPRTRMIQPNAVSHDPSIRVVTGATANDSFGWSADTFNGQLLVGAWGANNDTGIAYLLDLDDIPIGTTSVTDLSPKVYTTDVPYSRFGRDVAFIGDFLGQPSLAIGGDAIISDKATNSEGFSHAAHIYSAVLPDTDPVIPDEPQSPNAPMEPTSPPNSCAEISIILDIIDSVLGIMAWATHWIYPLLQYLPFPVIKFLYR